MNFYQKIECFEEFSDITNDSHFVEIPSDWLVIIADIKDSTQAIEAGRYKDVNTLGSAVIISVQNALGEGVFPFVFGGDGATLVIPSDALNVVQEQLSALKSLAVKNFNLSLRVGVVPISELNDTSIEVAKHRLNSNNYLAVFRGGGITLAEEMVKQGNGRYDIAEVEDTIVDLSGLSCRWQSIKPQRDYSLSLLVKSRGDAEVYNEILTEFTEIFGGDMNHANPVNLDGTEYRTFKQCLNDERRYHPSFWSIKFLWRIAEIFIAVMIFRHGFPAPFNVRKYLSALSTHSDYRKFDDMLRMVMDCSEAQFSSIRSLLQSLHEDQKIFYGLHPAKESLMTCFFHGPDEGEHIHFIDGGDGGYAMASKQLKTQMAER